MTDTPQDKLSFLGAEMVAQSMNKDDIEAWVGFGSFVGAFAGIWKYRKLLLRLGGVGLIGWLALSDKGEAILEILMP